MPPDAAHTCVLVGSTLSHVKTQVKTADAERKLSHAAGSLLSDVLQDNGLGLNQRCGGVGNCGGCAIILEHGTFTVGAQCVSVTAHSSRQVAACKTVANTDGCVIQVPARSLFEAGGSIDAEFDLPSFVLDAQLHRIAFAMPAASLTDHRADLERMVDSLCQSSGLVQLHVPLAQIRLLARMLARGVDRMTATLAADAGRWSMIALREGSDVEPAYGLALDIGTTTVAGVLVDLGTGDVVRKAARYNQQLSIADDIAARISAAKSEPDIERLRKKLVSDTINPIIASLCHTQGIAHEDICRISIAGHTVMVHLLLGLPVANIGRVPFNPVIRHLGSVTAAQIGVTTNRQAPVHIAPAIAGYVGGDVTAGIYATQLLAGPDCSLFVDLGTNCEMVFRFGDRLVCCATPAGPAFEGGGLLQGCRGTDGAIERIAIGPDLQLSIEVIGGGAPHGVCGSAVIDFIAEGLRCGLITAAGRLDVPRLQRHKRFAQVRQGQSLINACIIVPENVHARQECIVITEADIAEILQAKAAVFAGMQTLLGSCGLVLEQVERLVLAGGFARHIDIGNAQAIGLLPRLPRARIEVVGNTALAGAYLALVDIDAAPAMQALHLRPEVVELNLLRDFEANFIDALYLPEPIQGTGRATGCGC